ncbi:DHH family phosphoesterase [Patescibacteria group bacterium]|nr:DHH family phosphoesterase [Patescibacteria group bacterium]
MEEAIKAKKIIENAKKIVILISSPDGDSVGSSIVLKHYLEDRNKIVDLFSFKKPSPIFLNFKDIGDIDVTNTTKIDYTYYDAIIIIDSGSIHQVYDYQRYPNFRFPSTTPLIAIDHHLSNTHYAKYNIYDTNAGATGELIYKYFIKDEYDLDDDERELLYFALVWDTGSFRYHVREETLQIAAELLKGNIDIDKLSSLYFENIDDDVKRVLPDLIQKTVMRKNPRFVYLYLSLKHMQKLKMKPFEIKKYIDVYRGSFQINMKDYDIFIVITERKDYKIISVRGKPYTNKIDLSKLI